MRADITRINLPISGVDHHLLFGGTRKSSYGPYEQGAAALEFSTPVKVYYT
jgi:alpha-ketoglutaric semialdehyde dehydrogenase